MAVANDHSNHGVRNAQYWASLPGRTMIDPHVREHLRNLVDQSGLLPKQLLAQAKEIPEGLKPTIINGWLRAKKPTKTADKSFLDFVLIEYKRHINQTRLLLYLRQAVDDLRQRGSFDREGKFHFRKTQREALDAYAEFLNNPDLPDDEKLQGFFEIPTGVGKTAVFTGIVANAHMVAEMNGDSLRTVIVVPRDTLLTQTKDAFADFGPDMKGKIGLYNSANKDLSKPITLTTYESWNILINEGKIGNQNVDIVISDEAHRGTSDMRSLALENAFGQVTARYAFTATAHFDEQKSVEATHKNQIYYKALADAVRDSELAHYISAQLYLIRVEPPDITSMYYGAAHGDGQLRTKLRREAWNKRVNTIFQEGHDRITGDLLSDNQTGFFVEGIEQANDLEKMLNDNPVLQQRAAAQGYKQVAVAIHSGLSKPEQQRRFNAYTGYNPETDTYGPPTVLAVIGDEMFKEGFDHKPMKTVIDCQHGSSVDKAQILGRGARMWWNEKKHRWEGLTFIDTITYVGSKNEEENEKFRKQAIRNAITAADILKDVVVLSPGAEARSKTKIDPEPEPEVEEEFIIDGDEIKPVAVDQAGDKSDPVLFNAIEVEQTENSPNSIVIMSGEPRVPIPENNGSTGHETIPSPNGNLELVYVSSHHNQDSSGHSDDVPNPNSNGRLEILPIIHGDSHATTLVGIAQGQPNALQDGNNGEIESAPNGDPKLVQSILKNVRSDIEELTPDKKPNIPTKAAKPIKGQDVIEYIEREHYYELLSERAQLNEPVTLIDYTLEEIIDSCTTHFEETGERPRGSGVNAVPIDHGALKGKTSFTAINARIKAGLIEGCDADSLADLQNNYNIGRISRNAGKRESKTLTIHINDVLASAQIHLESTGKRPSQRSGPVELGPLKELGLNWQDIHDFSRHGKIIGTNEKGLSNIFNAYGVGESRKPVVKSHDISEEDIINSGWAFFHVFNRRPKRTDGLITQGSLKDKGTWDAIHTKLRRQTIVNCEFKKLDDLFDASGIPKNYQSDNELNF